MPLPILKSTDAASRRIFLRSAGVLTAGAALGGRPAAWGVFPVPWVLLGTYRASGKPRPDLLLAQRRWPPAPRTSRPSSPGSASS